MSATVIPSIETDIENLVTALNTASTAITADTKVIQSAVIAIQALISKMAASAQGGIITQLNLILKASGDITINGNSLPGILPLNIGHPKPSEKKSVAVEPSPKVTVDAPDVSDGPVNSE